MNGIDTASIIVLASALAVVVWTDQTRHRIPNLAVAALTVAALVLHTINRGYGGLLFGITGAVTGLIVFLVPYLLRGMGGGDVKLMVAVGAVLGPSLALLTAVLSLLFGGAIGMLVLTWSLAKDANVDVTRALRLRFPYAAAIAAATAVTLLGWGHLWMV